MTILHRPTLVARRSATLAATLLLFVALAAGAQTPNAGGTVTERPFATRAELEALATRLEAEAARTGSAATRAQAAAVRQRLKVGDFPVGAKVTINPAGMTNVPPDLLKALSDTFTVRAGQMLQLPNLPAISMAGVLRSELGEHLTTQLERYLRNPAVTVDPLVQVQIAGAVARPGFYEVPADTKLADVLMSAAGGPANNGDLSRTVVKRGGETHIPRDSLQRALTAGATLDQIDYRPGDVIEVGKKREFSWQTVLAVVGAATSIVWLIARVQD